MQLTLSQQGIDIIARLLAFATAIPFHESAHAFVSDKLGDHTARNLGRLTLNPLRHIDPWGLLAMLTIGFGWAKPVPINPGAYKNPKTGMAITAAAGPISNLLLAYINMVIYKAGFYLSYSVWGSAQPEWAVIVLSIIETLVVINVTLAVFNMLPIPPFDGSRIFGLFLPTKWYFAVQKYERYIMFGTLILLWLGAFSGVLSTAYTYVLRGMSWATGYVDFLFLRFVL
ncbi:MAG: site-2 protease family protein [Oscillospiraceae bacterium]